MNKLLLIMANLALFLPEMAYSQTKEPPSYLKDAVIELKLKNGDVYSFPGKDWMVVRRDSVGKTAACPACSEKSCPVCPADKNKAEMDLLQLKIAAQNKEIVRLTGILSSSATARPPASPAPVCPTLPTPQCEPAAVASSDAKLNRVTAILGLGVQYTVVEDELGQYLDTALAPVAGMQYSRILYDAYSVTVGAMTNQTYLLGVGYDW